MTEEESEPLDNSDAEPSRRVVRSTKLLAVFQNGLAVGWRMAVPECFRAALDIRLTPRIVAKEVVMTWTQGRMFAFKEGDTLYNVLSPEGDWSLRLATLELCVQVQRAAPARYVGRRFDPGSVNFSVLRPNTERTGVVVDGNAIECSQHAFVDFLRTGSVSAIGRGQVMLLPTGATSDEP